MRTLIGLVFLALAHAVTAQTPGTFVVKDKACIWTMPTDKGEVERLFKDAPINWCGELGIKKVSVKVDNDKDDGYRLKGHIWFLNKGKSDQMIRATLDLLDGEKMIAGALLHTHMDNSGNDREDFKIQSPIPVDYHITFRITMKRDAK